MSRVDPSLLQSQAQLLAGNLEIHSDPWPPFHDKVIAFFDELSRQIDKHWQKRFPDLATLCFWLRKRHLETYVQARDMDNRSGLGLAFHIAPNNVPLNFFYSYAIGLLAGNSNIVRLPSTDFEQITPLLETVNRLFNKPEYGEVYRRSLFIRYDSDLDLTRYLSKVCQARVIWGGDETVNKIRSLTTSPRTVDIPFANRYSLALLDGDAVAKLNADEIKRLCEYFYNDAYQMDQRACSSPALLCWLNDSEHQGKQRFWLTLADIVAHRYSLIHSQAVEKYTHLVKLLADHPNLEPQNIKNNHIYRLYSKELTSQLFALKGDSGFFIETNLDDVTELFSKLDQQIQTVCYFGIEPQALADQLIASGCLGVDRIVPIGQALDFDFVWDGMDLINSLSRIITVR